MTPKHRRLAFAAVFGAWPVAALAQIGPPVTATPLAPPAQFAPPTYPQSPPAGIPPSVPPMSGANLGNAGSGNAGSGNAGPGNAGPGAIVPPGQAPTPVVPAAPPAAGTAPRAPSSGAAVIPNTWLPQGTAILRGLDKVNAQSATVTIKVGQSGSFGSLTIAVQACVIRPPDQPADAAAYLVITDSHPDSPGFKGWMLKQEPEVSMLEHPVYDIRIAGCGP